MVSGSDEDRKILADFILAEYSRLTAEIRDDWRNMFLALSFLGAIAAGVVVAAFQTWEKPILSAILFVWGLPVILTIALSAGFFSISAINRKTAYIQRVLASRANKLFAGLPRAGENINIWGWDEFENAQDSLSGGHPRANRLLTVILAVLLLVPVFAAGYVELFSKEDGELSFLPLRILILAGSIILFFTFIVLIRWGYKKLNDSVYLVEKEIPRSVDSANEINIETT